jgi:hypothetical protein
MKSAISHKNDGIEHVKDVLLLHGININPDEYSNTLFTNLTKKKKVITIYPEAELYVASLEEVKKNSNAKVHLRKGCTNASKPVVAGQF